MNPFRRIATQRSRHERLVHFPIENYAGNLTPLTRPEQVRVGSDPGTDPIKAKILGERALDESCSIMLLKRNEKSQNVPGSGAL